MEGTEIVRKTLEALFKNGIPAYELLEPEWEECIKGSDEIKEEKDDLQY